MVGEASEGPISASIEPPTIARISRSVISVRSI